MLIPPTYNMGVAYRGCRFCHKWWMWEIKNKTNKKQKKCIGKCHFIFESWKCKMSYGEYVQLEWEKIVDVKYNMAKLVDLA